MRKYYTRPCNFYYGDYAKKLVKRKKAFPLAGNSNIAFDLSMTSFNFFLHSMDRCDLDTKDDCKFNIDHPGLLAVGPLEKFGLDGFLSGLFIILFD